jgi:hypothetical protein
MFIGMNVGNDGGLIPGVQFSTSMSDFTRRLLPPSRPGEITLVGFWIWWIIMFPVATIIVFSWLFQTPAPDIGYTIILAVMCLPFSMPLSLVLAFIAVFAVRIIRNRSHKYWLYAYNRYRNALYCPHDNVVFDYEIFGYPQDYIRTVFGGTPAKYALN